MIVRPPNGSLKLEVALAFAYFSFLDRTEQRCRSAVLSALFHAEDHMVLGVQIPDYLFLAEGKLRLKRDHITQSYDE